MSDVAVIDFTGCEESVRAAFDAVNGADVLAGSDRILLKPNLVNASPFPVVVAEGCGGAAVEAPEVFAALGASRWPKRWAWSCSTSITRL